MPAEDKKSLEKLKSTLDSEKDSIAEIDSKINKLAFELNEGIAHKINSASLLSDKLDYLKEHMPEMFGPMLSEAIKDQVKNSKGEMISALYPIIGKLIKKYVAEEIKTLNDKIDQKMGLMFSFDNIVKQIKCWISGVSVSESLVASLGEPEIQEVFIIQQDTGTLLASYSRNKTMDQDMIAAMLTAIKSFIGDAFDSEQQDVESIEYETNKIIIKNMGAYYFAVVISGVINQEFKNRLDDQVLQFGEKISLSYIQEQYESTEEAILQDEIKEIFSIV